jgi:hypothetical protein
MHRFYDVQSIKRNYLTSEPSLKKNLTQNLTKVMKKKNPPGATPAKKNGICSQQ